MEIDVIIQQLHKLSRPQKFQIVQLLIDELAETEELPFVSSATYEVWSPQDTSSAAATLLAMLDEEKHTNDE